MIRTKKLAKSDRLASEYQYCFNKSQQLENTIWVTSSIIGIGSFIPISVELLSASKPEIVPFSIIFITLLSLNVTWYSIASRWWDLQHITFLRMKHIERLLGMYSIQYIDHFDGIINLEPGSQLSQDCIIDLNNANTKSKHLRGVKKWLRIFPFFLIFAWGEYYLYSSNIFCFNNWSILLIAVPHVLAISINEVRTRIESCKNTQRIKART